MSPHSGAIGRLRHATKPLCRRLFDPSSSSSSLPRRRAGLWSSAFFPESAVYHHGHSDDLQTRRRDSSSYSSSSSSNDAWPDDAWKSKTNLANDHFARILRGDRPPPPHFNFSKDIFKAIADNPKEGDACALWHVDRDGIESQTSFHEMLLWSQRMARFLRDDCKIAPADRLLVILPRIPEWWALNLAAIQCGIITIPGTTQLTPSDIAKRIAAADVAGIVCDGDTVQKVACALRDNAFATKMSRLKVLVLAGEQEPLLENPSVSWKKLPTVSSQDYKPLAEYYLSKSTEPSSMFFTSGTTGLPKLTVHSHVSYGLAHWTTGRLWLDAGPGDVVWNLSDTGWAKAAYSSFYAPWIVGATVFSCEMPHFSGKSVLDALEKYPVTVMCFPPTAVRNMVQEDLKLRKFSRLRHCVSGGEPLNPEVISKWEGGTGVSLLEGYGQTETTLSAGSLPGLERRPSSMGKALLGYEFVVVSENSFEILPPQEEGILALDLRRQRPVGLFSGYWENPEATSSVFKDGFYLTGDRARMDEDGFIYFVSRADDVIISSGYRIGPFEVESALIEHPAVAESAVVAAPDPARGEVVKAFVVLSESHRGVQQRGGSDVRDLVADIQNHVKRVTAPYKYPRQIVFVDSLPKTISGKIRRVELRNNEFGKSPS